MSCDYTKSKGELERERFLASMSRADRRRYLKKEEKGEPWQHANLDAAKYGPSVPPRRVRRNARALDRWIGRG